MPLPPHPYKPSPSLLPAPVPDGLSQEHRRKNLRDASVLWDWRLLNGSRQPLAVILKTTLQKHHSLVQ